MKWASPKMILGAAAKSRRATVNIAWPLILALMLFIPSRLDPLPTLEAAKADATARVPEEAKDACQGLD